jgi:hypothetical protein
MVKTKEEQTTKERNTQRRKRKNGWFHKAYLLGKICDFEVAAYVRNPDSGQIYTYRSKEGVWFPRSMEDIVSSMARPLPSVGMLILRRSWPILSRRICSLKTLSNPEREEIQGRSQG